MPTLGSHILHPSSVLTPSLTCLLSAGIARHQHQASVMGSPGFSVHQTEGGRTATAHFLELLMKRLLLEDTPQVGELHPRYPVKHYH